MIAENMHVDQPRMESFSYNRIWHKQTKYYRTPDLQDSMNVLNLQCLVYVLQHLHETINIL